MSTLTIEQLDERLDKRFATQTEQIIGFVKRGFDEMTTRIDEQGKEIATVRENLATLTTSVDRFAKIYTDLNQEFVVMRQHLRDVEMRVEKLEMRLKAA